jgi:hypothetical protein
MGGTLPLGGSCVYVTHTVPTISIISVEFLYIIVGIQRIKFFVMLSFHLISQAYPDHYLVVAKVRERLAVRKQAAQNFDGERFNLRKLSELEVKEKYQIEITNRFAALENLDVDEDVNRAWENIKENIKTSAKESLGLLELKRHKPWFDEGCVGFLHQRKQAKMQWIQDPSRSNADNLNKVRHDASRHFRNKEKAYLKAKIEELETNSKVKNVRDLYRDINDFRKGYQPRTIIVKEEKGDLVADSHSIITR